MKSSLQDIKSAELSPTRWIFGGLIFVTLYFQTNLADPFNSPKSWILLITATWLAGYIINFRKIIFSTKPIKNLFYAITFFTLTSLLVTIFTDSLYVAVFGDTQRRNGFVSYLSLAIVLIASSLFIRLFNIKRLYVTTYIIGSVSFIYALMQTTGNDFVKWNNSYNSIIGTLGNPNFAAAVMAIIGVITFSSIFIGEFKLYFRISALILTLALIFVIYKSNAKQGLLSYILGGGFFLIILLWSKSKKLGIVSVIIGIFIFLLSVLGMLQVGPFQSFLYKPSVSVRGYYWRAAFEMFKDNPIFGVGMDRFGAYFKQYREVNYPLNYGFEITSSNAHNTFIQFFATGGLFLGMSYLVLNAYILKRAIYGLKKLEGDSRLLLAGVFSAWISFHAQSLVSIDNVGISIWGWVLGGSIIGLSLSSSNLGEDKKFFQVSKNKINLSRALISGGATLLAVFLVAILYRGESNSYNAQAPYNLQDPAVRLVFKDAQLKAINSKLNDPTNSLNCAVNLIEGGFMDEGLEIIKSVHNSDPRDINAINYLAITYEYLNNIPQAITYRKKMVKLDPWNPVNYLQLGKDYKAQGNLIKSKEMLDKILSFSTGVVGGPIAEQAKKELSQ